MNPSPSKPVNLNTLLPLVKNLAIILFFYLFTALFPLSLGLSQEAKRISSAEAAKLGVGQNIEFVERLINESAAAKQIIDSDNSEAHKLRETALQHLKDAREADAKGDSQAVAEALHKAKTTIFKGMRLVGKKVVADKKQDNYQKKRKSLEALLEAHQRIITEKGNDSSSQEVENFAREKMKEAQTQSKKGNFNEAQSLINSAYLSVKTSITKFRDGKTLVRTRQSAGGYLSQHDPRLHFGLGEHDRVERLEVTWPDGSKRILKDVPVDRQVTIRQRREGED